MCRSLGGGSGWWWWKFVGSDVGYSGRIFGLVGGRMGGGGDGIDVDYITLVHFEWEVEDKLNLSTKFLPIWEYKKKLIYRNDDFCVKVHVNFK